MKAFNLHLYNLPLDRFTKLIYQPHSTYGPVFLLSGLQSSNCNQGVSGSNWIAACKCVISHLTSCPFRFCYKLKLKTKPNVETNHIKLNLFRVIYELYTIDKWLKTHFVFLNTLQVILVLHICIQAI